MTKERALLTNSSKSPFRIERCCDRTLIRKFRQLLPHTASRLARGRAGKRDLAIPGIVQTLPNCAQGAHVTPDPLPDSKVRGIVLVLVTFSQSRLDSLSSSEELVPKITQRDKGWFVRIELLAIAVFLLFAPPPPVGDQSHRGYGLVCWADIAANHCLDPAHANAGPY